MYFIELMSNTPLLQTCLLEMVLLYER